MIVSDVDSINGVRSGQLLADDLAASDAAGAYDLARECVPSLRTMLQPKERNRISVSSLGASHFDKMPGPTQHTRGGALHHNCR